MQRAHDNIRSTSYTPMVRYSVTTDNERQIFIRGIQAVIEIPVKTESVGDNVVESAFASMSASSSASGSFAPVSKGLRSSKDSFRTADPIKSVTCVKRKARAKRIYADIGDEYESLNVSEASEQPESSTEYGQTNYDDDELLIGAEVSWSFQYLYLLFGPDHIISQS
jgi:hypothetical protein